MSTADIPRYWIEKAHEVNSDAFVRQMSEYLNLESKAVEVKKE